MPKNIKDIDMVNSHPVILLNLCQKTGVACNILKNYVENRDLILNSFGDNRKSVKEMFLTIYDKTIEIYKKLGCKNVKSYLEIYMKLDVCLQSDIYNVFRDCIWNKLEIDCSKYVTSCSLSLD